MGFTYWLETRGSAYWSEQLLEQGNAILQLSLQLQLFSVTHHPPEAAGITVVNINDREVGAVDRNVSCVEASQREFCKVNSKVGGFEKLPTERTESVPAARGGGRSRWQSSSRQVPGGEGKHCITTVLC